MVPGDAILGGLETAGMTSVVTFEKRLGELAEPLGL
jgi:hypothetical protein